MKNKLIPVLTSISLLAAMPAFSHSKTNVTNKRTTDLEQRVRTLSAQVEELKKNSTNVRIGKKKVDYSFQQFRDVLGGTPVTTSPYIGTRTDLAGQNLIVNIPSVNQDLYLLKQRQRMDSAFRSHGEPVPTVPVVDLSGKIEAQAYIENPYNGVKTTDIDLASATLDTAAFVHPWVTAFIALNYDSMGPTSGIASTRSANSRFFVDEGFVTIGNFEQSNFYASAGQMIVPFGRYSTNMISLPLPFFLGRTKARAVLFGYNYDGPVSVNASVFGFKGNTSLVHSSARVNKFGANVDVAFPERDGFTGKIGGSYMNNIAEADGMQSNGVAPTGTNFAGFGVDGSITLATASQVLNKRVGGYSVRGQLDYRQFLNFQAEYITAAERFHISDMTFNGSAAKPSALNAEAALTFPVMSTFARLSAGFGTTREAAALNREKNRYIATLSTVVVPNTITSLEWRHDVNYSADTVATGRGRTVSVTDFGKSRDYITARISVYW